MQCSTRSSCDTTCVLDTWSACPDAYAGGAASGLSGEGSRRPGARGAPRTGVYRLRGPLEVEEEAEPVGKHGQRAARLLVPGDRVDVAQPLRVQLRAAAAHIHAHLRARGRGPLSLSHSLRPARRRVASQRPSPRPARAAWVRPARKRRFVLRGMRWGGASAGRARVARPLAAAQRQVVYARVCPGLVRDLQQLAQLRVHPLRAPRRA